MSPRAGANATAIPRCQACGKGRHSSEDCLAMHPHKATEWLQDKLKSKNIGKGHQAKPPAQGGCKGKGSPHKRAKFPPCKGCGSTLHPPEDCWTLHPELQEKSRAEGRLGKRHNREGRWHRWRCKKIDQARRDMGPSPATVCAIMWVNLAQAWADSYCTRTSSSYQWGQGGNSAGASTWARGEAHRTGDIYPPQRNLGTNSCTIALGQPAMR